MEIFSEQRGKAAVQNSRQRVCVQGSAQPCHATQPAGSLLSAAVLGMPCSLESNVCASPRQDLELLHHQQWSYTLGGMQSHPNMCQL